ncbi:hypothetical protein Tco_1283472 [Tanacetum coccineum]
MLSPSCAKLSNYDGEKNTMNEKKEYASSTLGISSRPSCEFIPHNADSKAKAKLRRNVKTLDEAIAAAESIVDYSNRPRRPLAEYVDVERVSPKKLEGRRNEGRVSPKRRYERGD